ncbi:MAG: YHS domain-containing protein [Deltaproteobacteria bacterium]|nr:YHS domain-containing protein [Deltaproteobacteria bacterium]
MEATEIKDCTFIDPVCGMIVAPGTTRLVSNYQGHSYWFCSEACRGAFEANPNKYLNSKTPKRKGLWGRYLERLNRATSGKPLKCH